MTCKNDKNCQVNIKTTFFKLKNFILDWYHKCVSATVYHCQARS